MQGLRTHYCTVAFLALTIAASAQTRPIPDTDAELTIFLGGAAVGRERVRVSHSAGTVIVTSTGSSGAPFNLTINRFELKYAQDWQPIELHIEAVQSTPDGTHTMGLATSFGLTTAINEITRDRTTNSKTDQVSARTIVLPNNFYAGYVALAARLQDVEPGADLPVYVAPQTEIRMRVTGVVPQQIQSPSGTVSAKQYSLSFANPGGTIESTLTADDSGRFVRFDLPKASLAVVRSDLATVSTRTTTARNPTDSDVTIPANGFGLAGTLTLPPKPGRLKHPSVILVAGSGQNGRDEIAAGLPVFAQIAGALAEQGYAVLRYDKRGVGQSGGRSEAAGLTDYADDLIAAVRWMDRQPFADRRRIAVAGHSEGGWIAMLAAAREDRISSVALLSTPGTSGADLILEQQRHLLDVAKAPEAERRAKIDLQQRIQAAVVSNKGWEGIPLPLRRQADTPWFRSFLLFDPLKAVEKVGQPILVVQGQLDSQVQPRHADLLYAAAQARKKKPRSEVVRLDGVGHLLVLATTGEMTEYASLKGKPVAPPAVDAIVEWLKK